MRKLGRDLGRSAAVILLLAAGFFGYRWVTRWLHPIVPDQPVTLVIADYKAGFDGQHPFLARRLIVHDRHTVSRFVHDLNDMQSLGAGNSSCPQYHLGWYDLLQFRYTHGPTWTVEALIGRCGQPPIRANTVVWAAQSPRLLKDLNNP